MRRLLVDATAELRSAAIRYEIDRLDGVLITHAHADHIFGIDDLRRFNAIMGGPLDLFTERDTHVTLAQMFRYIFDPHTNVNQTFIAQLIVRFVEPGVAFDVFGAKWIPLRLMHGRLPILGFRIEFGGQAVAYCTDVSGIPPETYPLLEGLDVLVIDGLRYKHHPTHFTVEQALEQIDQVKPKKAYLTHIAHDILHAELEPRLPKNVFLPYDGLRITGDSG